MLVSPIPPPFRIIGALDLVGVLTPFDPLAAVVHDFTPLRLESVSVLRLIACPGGGTVSGLVAPSQSQQLLVFNISTAEADRITLLPQDAGSSAANRFAGPLLVLPPDGAVMLWYDLASARWRMVRC